MDPANWQSAPVSPFRATSLAPLQPYTVRCVEPRFKFAANRQPKSAVPAWLGPKLISENVSIEFRVEASCKVPAPVTSTATAEEFTFRLNTVEEILATAPAAIFKVPPDEASKVTFPGNARVPAFTKVGPV